VRLPLECERKDTVAKVRRSKNDVIKALIHDARNFRFCGPSDDPDEQTSVTTAYYHLVVQFKRLAGPLLTPEAAARLEAIAVDFDNLYSAYEARAELDALLPEIESTLDAIEQKESMVDQPAPRGQLSALFVNHASDVLADTNLGLTGAEIVRSCAAFAIELNVSIARVLCH
jgi:hypothetical protein